jgi:hypothetical protein
VALRTISRRFPDYGWSWPSGKLDQLLKAALLQDEEVALNLASSYLDENDVDLAPAREHRLLAAIAERFGNRLSTHQAYIRLAGMQKFLWTKSRLAMHEALPALRLMAGDGRDVMLFKGAGRIAVDPAAQRGRVAHDIDVLVRPEDLEKAFEILRENGWAASTGASPHYVKSILPALQSLNFFKGSFGDIDLHQAAYNVSQRSAEDDITLWERAVAARFCGVDVLAPSPADRVALAVAHGGLDAHAHSDWLVDSAVAISGGEVDWNTFLGIVEKRRIAVPAAIALSYLRLEIGVSVPDDVLGEVVALADRAGPSLWSSLLQAKPRTDFGVLSWASRGLAKQMRLKKKRAERQVRLPDVVWSGNRVWNAPSTDSARPALSEKIVLPEASAGKTLRVALLVKIGIPPVRRRIEMEINSEKRHIARLRYRTLRQAEGARLLRFEGTIEPEPGETQVILEARPSRQFREWRDEASVAAYGALPFQLISAKISVEAAKRP